jgi:hypothetical protein
MDNIHDKNTVYCICLVFVYYVPLKKYSPLRRMRAGLSVRLSVRSGGRGNGVGEISFKPKYHRFK